MPKHRDAEGGSSAAMIDQPKRSADEIAVAAAAQAARISRAERAKDIARWRRIVSDIADGVEPDGAVLAAISLLTARLSLPEGSLASCVATVERERKLIVDLENATRVGNEAEAEMAALGDQVRAAEQKLIQLRLRAEQNILDQQQPAFLRQRLNELRENHPLLFEVLNNCDGKDA